MTCAGLLKDEELFARFLDKAKINDGAVSALELWPEDQRLANRMLLELPDVSENMSELFQAN